MSLTTDTPSAAATPRRRDTSHYGTGPDDRLIPLREVMALLGYGRTSVYALIKAGTFPSPVKTGIGDSSRWPLGEVRQFIAKAMAARGAPKQPSAGARH
jgi:prophage regulatory protein